MFSFSRNRIDTESSVLAVNSIFTHLEAPNGGAISSRADVKHKILYCSFYLCNATLKDTGRGGAFCITKGDLTVRGCCTDSCNGVYCSDILSHRPNISKLSYISSNNAKAEKHSFYSSATTKNELKFINVSNSITSYSLGYSCGINIGGTCEVGVRFINLVDCVGQSGIICVDASSNINVHINNANIIKQTGIHSILLIYGSNNKCIISDSSFLQITCGLAQIGNSNIANFQRCKFSIKEPSSTLGVTVTESSFDAISNEFSHNNYYSCYINLAKKWCMTRYRKHYHNHFVFAFIFITKQ